MRDRPLSGSKFWLLGAAYWIVLAALFAGALRFWPGLAGSQSFFAAAVIGALVGGVVIVYLFQPKS
ncbi:MAG TPA: hypothetical protein VMU01_07350 [Rhizomicrobium sp.]|nr:hypothetical protein [Rhizomicrobium sp.]